MDSQPSLANFLSFRQAHSNVFVFAVDGVDAAKNDMEKEPASRLRRHIGQRKIVHTELQLHPELEGSESLCLLHRVAA